MQADRYKVVVNDEEQYSIWPADREAPAGWREVGPEGRDLTHSQGLGRVSSESPRRNREPHHARVSSPSHQRAWHPVPGSAPQL